MLFLHDSNNFEACFFTDKPVNIALNGRAGLECFWSLGAAPARAYTAFSKLSAKKKTPEKANEGFLNTSWMVQQPTVTCLGVDLISKMIKCMLGLSAVVKSSL